MRIGGSSAYGKTLNRTHLPDDALVACLVRAPRRHDPNKTHMQTPLFRKVETSQDWEKAISLRNELLWQRPITLEELEDWFARVPDGAFHTRYLMSLDGEDVGFYSLLTPFWLDAKGLIDMSCYTRDPGLHGIVLDRAIETAKEVGADRVSTWARSDRPEQATTAESKGFSLGQRNPECGLDLRQFDPDQFRPTVESVRSAGFEIVTYTEYAARNPDTFHHDLWRLECDVLADVPFPEPHKDETLDEFVKFMESPLTRLDSMVVALKDGQVAGMSQLTPNRVDLKVMATGLTGVRREHRRQGLALAMKVVSLTWAKEHGAQWVFTDNEENNPMYDLNLKLGFEKQFEWVCCERSVVGSEAGTAVCP